MDPGGLPLSRVALVLVLALTAPALAGCLGDEPAPAATDGVAANAADAGAVAGPAPAAAKDAYALQEEDASFVVHPVEFPTNAAKAPYEQEFTGVWSPQECAPTGGGLPLGGLGLASGRKRFDVSEAFLARDVFGYDVSLTWTNTDDSWAELHLWHQLGDVSEYWSEPTSEGRGEVTLNFTGQGFIRSEDFSAEVGVDCWFGRITQPIPFTMRVAVSFAERALPAQVPVLLQVPEGATRIVATGVPLDPEAPVLSHYRVFGPDDALLCECALNSDEAADVLEVGPGDHVILVDHTANGFLSIGLDAAPPAPLLPLEREWTQHRLLASDGGPVDETVVLDLPTTPLNMWAWVFARGERDSPPDAGTGHNTKIQVVNGRGDVLRISMVAFVTYRAGVPGMFGTNDWFAIPLDGEWEFFVEHHAFDLGPHSVHVTAEALRGEASLFVETYVRPA